MSTPEPNRSFGWKAHRRRGEAPLDSAAPLSIVGISTPAQRGEAPEERAPTWWTSGQALIAGPYPVNKWQRNLEKDVIPCLSYNEGCIWGMARRQQAKCAINPRGGSEAVSMEEKATQPKKRSPSGGQGRHGPCPLRDVTRHGVILFGKSDKLGALAISRRCRRIAMSPVSCESIR